LDLTIKKALWFGLGIILIGIAYLGLILPGIPWSTPAVGAAYCFAKSSDRMHNWIYSHKIFGPFLIGWQEKRIFPTKAKYLMLLTMLSSLVIMWLTTGNLVAIGYVSMFMLICVIWGWRYPGSEEEYEKRVKEGKRIAWLR
jgi:uncharacterized membrane protein YbaN (DUF454 family)